LSCSAASGEGLGEMVGLVAAGCWAWRVENKPFDYSVL
jgi:hypothetical protein